MPCDGAIVDGEGFGKEIYGNTLAATLAGVRDDEKGQGPWECCA